MIRRTLTFTLAIITFAALIVIAADTVSVVVKKSSLRKSNKFYASTVTEVKQGDTLVVISEEKGWIKVSKNGKEGWVHASAVSSKVGSASSSGSKVASNYSTDEIALAGKGFSEQVEGSYRKSNPDLNFAAVDKMEKSTVAASTVIAFQDKGKLKEREVTP